MPALTETQLARAHHLLTVRKLSYVEASEALECSIDALRRALPGLSSPARPGRRARHDISDADVLDAIATSDSQARAAELLGCSRTLVRGRLYALGITDANPTGKTRRRPSERW